MEEEIADRQGYEAARASILKNGYGGHFFDLEVRYYDIQGWTYWSSPLAMSYSERYMINSCRTEYTWDALSKAGELPPEGFEGKILSLTPLLENPMFQELVRSGKVDGEIEKRHESGHRHRKLFHALPFLIQDESILNQCNSEELDEIKSILAVNETAENSTEAS